jgi:hypothetical protein
VANPEWCVEFVGAEVVVLARRNSDHNSLLLSFENGGMRK